LGGLYAACLTSPLSLITPALFSHRPPPNREKREKARTPHLRSPLPVGGRAVGEETVRAYATGIRHVSPPAAGM
jgi:hypothetical protein